MRYMIKLVTANVDREIRSGDVVEIEPLPVPCDVYEPLDAESPDLGFGENDSMGEDGEYGQKT